MSINIHPLQEASVSLLRALYFDMKLPTTKAMLSITNGYYPSIDEILSTLNHYKDQDLVSEFIRANETSIADAENDVRNAKISQEEAKKRVGKTEEDIFSSIFSPTFEPISAYKCMKEVTLKSIEESLSKDLSNLCGEDLVLEIESIQEKRESTDYFAELSVKVKSKHSFR